MSDKEKVVRISETGCQGQDGCYVKVSGLKEDEAKRFEASFRLGCSWVRKTENGRLESRSVLKQLPDQRTDEDMLPFWRRFDSRKTGLQTEIFDPERLSGHSSPSITIQSLCGYEYTPERYKVEAAKLENYGFECLRSRRGEDGRFWEIWYLPGLWSAKGALKEKIGDNVHDNKKGLEIAISFLCRNCLFGTLDISVQRAAMTID